MCGGGGGVGDRRESPVKTHSIFVCVFFLHMLLLFLFGWEGGGGVIFLYSLFH